MADGYGWPVSGIFDLGWEKVTKFRIEPAFYSVEVNVLVNLDAWKGLNDAQRKVLSDAGAWLEGLDSERPLWIASERDRQTKAGIQPIEFGPTPPRRSSTRRTTSRWQSIIKRRRRPARSCGSCRGIERCPARDAARSDASQMRDRPNTLAVPGLQRIIACCAAPGTQSHFS